MSMKFDNVFEERGKRLKSEPEPEPKRKPNRLKSDPEFLSGKRGKWLNSEPELELGSGLGLKQTIKTKPGGDLEERDFSMYENSSLPYMYKRGDFVYKNKVWREADAAFEDYYERSRNLSPYDAIAIPPIASFDLCGGVVPLQITDDKRPTLISFCELALRDYNQRIQGPTFVFHDLIKCTYDGATADKGYHITFQAKAEEDPSNSPSNIPALATFQAQVWVSKLEGPEVTECRVCH